MITQNARVNLETVRNSGLDDIEDDTDRVREYVLLMAEGTALADVVDRVYCEDIPDGSDTADVVIYVDRDTELTPQELDELDLEPRD